MRATEDVRGRRSPTLLLSGEREEGAERSIRSSASGRELVAFSTRMNHLLVDCRYSFKRDSVPLLDGKRVISVFELHEGPYPVITKVNHRLQVQRVRVDPDVRTEPSEERTVICSIPLVVEFAEMLKVLLVEGSPHSPGEDLVVT